MMDIKWEATDFVAGALVYSDVHGFGRILKSTSSGADRAFEIVFMLMSGAVIVPYTRQEIQKDLYPVRPMTKLHQAFTDFSMQAKTLKES